MPSTEIVTIVVGGVPYTGWKSMSVKMGAKSPERSFQITGALGADGVAAAILSIEAGAPCVLMSNGDVLCVGRVHEVEIELGPESHGIRLSGKSRGADAIKSSVDHDKHEFEQKDPLTIAQEIDKSGIGYKATVIKDAAGNEAVYTVKSQATAADLARGSGAVSVPRRATIWSTDSNSFVVSVI